MWKFRDLILKQPEEESVDPLTGEVTLTSPVEDEVSGVIVPASAEDINKGFQMGEYKAYCELPVSPSVNLHRIVDGSDEYDIKNVEYWKEKGIYALRLSK